VSVFTPQGLIAQILAAPKEFHGQATLPARSIQICKIDRMALIALQALLSEYPDATTQDVNDALVSALWWHMEHIATESPALASDTERK